MSEDTQYIKVGCLGKTFGIKGWIKLHSSSDPLEKIFSYNPLIMKVHGKYQPLEMDDYKPHGPQFIAHLPGCNTPEEAQHYVGSEIYIRSEQLTKTKTEKNEYYWRDLEGLTVVNKEGVSLGTVAFLIETGANDVLVVQGERERLVPYIKDVVLSVDLENKSMKVDWDPEF
jgi:16S rRNA processing protein RimM